jgi:hypothetical protein
LKTIDADWHSSNFNQVGVDGAKLGHDALGSTLELSADKDTLQGVFDGAFVANNLPKSTKMVPCIDDKSASLLVAFIPTILDEASSGSLADLLKIPAQLKEFAKQIPPQVGECIAPVNNTDTDALAGAYNHPEKDPNIAKKLITYVTLHYLHVHSSLKTIDADWHASNFN